MPYIYMEKIQYEVRPPHNFRDTLFLGGTHHFNRHCQSCLPLSGKQTKKGLFYSPSEFNSFFSVIWDSYVVTLVYV